MKAFLAMIGTIAFVIAVWSLPAKAESASNQAMKYCLEVTGYSLEKFDTFDFNKAAACHSDYRVGTNQIKLAELRDFLKHNPRYRYPGQSMNKCWGKPRVQPFESVSGTAGTWGYDITVKYKDTIPAGCYENGPWDNRDAGK